MPADQERYCISREKTEDVVEPKLPKRKDSKPKTFLWIVVHKV